MPRTLGGYILGATAFVACPCHLPLTLPLLLALLGGTSVGALLADNPLLVVVGATVYFLLALAGAWWFLGRRSGAGAGARSEQIPAVNACRGPTLRLPVDQSPGRTEVSSRG